MPRRYGTGDGIRGRGGRFSGDFSSRGGTQARLEELADRTTAAHNPRNKSRQVPEPITVHEYGGIGELRELTKNDCYPVYNHVVKQGLQPSNALGRAVTCFMVNMFLNLPGDDYSRRRYSNNDRRAMREQFDIFREGLMGLEILFGERSNLGIGGFKKITNWYEHVDYLVENVDLYSVSRSDIVYVNVPPQGRFSNREEKALEAVFTGYRDEQEPHLRVLKENASEALLQLMLNPELNDLESYIDSIGEYDFSNENGGVEEAVDAITPLLRLFDQMEKGQELTAVEDFKERYGAMLQKYPDQQGLISLMSQAVAEDGVLITEGADVTEIPNFRLVMSYRDCCMYQRVNPTSQ